MENNSCGFQISSSSADIELENDFGSRSSLLSSVGTEAAGSGGLHPAFFESIAGYLDRAPLAEALLRKGSGPVGVDPQMDNIISSSNTTGEVVGYGAVEQQNTSKGGGGTASKVGVGKKRSRASRRAPTTVLTTDTSNFRAMVQEFTGIPPAPFASTSPFPRTRLDFLGPRNPTNPFLLRPYPQRMPVGAQSFPTSNFPTPPPLFHSLLHPLNKTAPPPPPLSEAQVKAGLLEELGLNPPLLPDLVPSDRRSPHWSEACKISYNKSASAGGGSDLGRNRTLDLDDSIHNNAADHHTNTSNNMRPDRMVDSWISSSDQTLDKLVQ